jgi:hypothetical protein
VLYLRRLRVDLQMSRLWGVQSYMQWWGWTNGGNPGSEKRDAEGNVIARHGDSEWKADVEKACKTLVRIAEGAPWPG